MLIVVSEVSPYLLENYIVILFPFLLLEIGKGVFYIILGTFCFGEEMGNVGILAGALILIGGVFTIGFKCMDKKREEESIDVMQEMPQGYIPPNPSN